MEEQDYRHGFSRKILFVSCDGETEQPKEGPASESGEHEGPWRATGGAIEAKLLVLALK